MSQTIKGSRGKRVLIPRISSGRHASAVRGEYDVSDFDDIQISDEEITGKDAETVRREIREVKQCQR